MNLSFIFYFYFLLLPPSTELDSNISLNSLVILLDV